MPRRLLPTVLLLATGLLGLAWGLVSLQRIFASEREEAHAALRTRRASLEQYAEEAFRQALTRQLDRALPALEAARRDPLAPDTGLYLHLRGEQVLPRPTRPAVSGPDGDGSPVRARYEALRAGTTPAPGEDGWAGRVARVRALEGALARRERTRVEALLRELVDYTAAQPLPPEDELPLLLYVVERLEGSALLPPARVRSMLHSGESGGLQRLLLARRPWLSPEDFSFLLTRVVALSVRLGAPHRALLERAREPAVGALVLPPGGLPGPCLVGGRWLLEPFGERGARGVAVDTVAVAAQVEGAMRQRGLLAEGGRVAVLPGSGPLVPLEAVRLAVTLPAWEVEASGVEGRFRGKTALAAACGALAVAMVALGYVAQHRKQRFLALKSDFVATVSHELRTPLASIRLLAETLEHRLSAHPEARDYPQRIVREAEDLTFLVENVLSYNRVDKGRWRPQLSQVRLGELAASLRADLEPFGPEVELRVEGEDVELTADPSLVRLVLANLARNAHAYCARRPARLSLSAHPSTRHAARVALLFSDNGIGIPEEEWENVFGDFYRLRGPGREARGSGLGLALCRRVMALHGGDIRVAASGPEGTTFALFFPPARVP